MRNGAHWVATSLAGLVVGVCFCGCSTHDTPAQSAAADPPNATAPSPDIESTAAMGHDGDVTADTISVETIHPRPNPRGCVRTETEPAYVEGYFTADLMARVAGTVKSIEKNIGDVVMAGEVLVELDAPDLVQALAQKQALVEQAQQDSKSAQTSLKVAEACAKTADSLVAETAAAEARSAAVEKFHREEYHRYEVLASRDAVVGSVLDEKLRDLEAAEADYKTAQAATLTARARAAEYSAKVEEARVDIDVKKARVAVAVSDRDHAQAMVDFTKIRAPFDGVIVARKVDPGAFVQNASTGNPTPMLRVVRTDKVTFVTWVPEKDAPLVSKDTDATIRLDALGDEPIRTKVTRFSHWLDPDKSRDMRVEVDFDNKDGRLKPGMYGSMTLTLCNYGHVRMIPASAVFAFGGQTNVVMVRDGRAYRFPVRVEYEDGVQAKVVMVEHVKDPKTGQSIEQIVEPTENDEIIRSGQGELADGQPVKAVTVEW
jgi:multidrug resistance efflux pump